MAAVEQNEGVVESNDDGMGDYDEESGEWDDGFEESSDEGGVESSRDQEQDQRSVVSS